MSPLTYIVILGIIALFSACLVVLWRNEKKPLSYLILVCIINFIIIYLGVMSFALNNSVSVLFEGLILLGLVAGFISDIFLNFIGFQPVQLNQDEQNFQEQVITTSSPEMNIHRAVFVSKIVSYFMFMIAIVYLTTVSWLPGFIIGVAFATIAVFSDKLFKIDINNYKWISPVYAIILGTIIGQCIFDLILGSFTIVGLLALIGFLLLLFSDCLWNYSLFKNKLPKILETLRPIIYYFSQIIIASLLFFA
ncbi:MAG: lysoplasmalogenase family protein [Clostridia bacterium]|nr:lysoplasmalogenase family protein [Clostridia bacterium]MDD4685858.1 lysoplasmalogenase family protein [Clostridia bacterium]